MHRELDLQVVFVAVLLQGIYPFELELFELEQLAGLEPGLGLGLELVHKQIVVGLIVLGDCQGFDSSLEKL